MKKKKKLLERRICEYCKEKYQPKRQWQKYCSSLCRYYAWDEMNPRVKKIIAILIFIFLLTTNALAYTDTEIVDAIYKAEGSEKAQYLYGIRSVSYDSPEEARRICYNTVRNNRKRWLDYGHKSYRTYLGFLASRYAPLNADNDPQGLNRHWLKNVKYFLKQGDKK